MKDTEKSIWEKAEFALDKFHQQDKFLMEKDVNERSISHKLAIYLQEVFEEWNVDCEYNRDISNPKMIKELQGDISDGGPEDEHAHTVYPDIIVHHRGKQENLLVIEIKKSTNQDSGASDKKKLKAYKEQLGYQYALFLRIYTDSYFVRGERWYEKEFVLSNRL